MQLKTKEADRYNPREDDTRGLLETDLVILNHDQVTRTTPELESPLLSSTLNINVALFSCTRAFSYLPHQREDVRASRDLTCIASLHGGSSAVLDGDRFNSCQVIYSQFGLSIHQNDHQARRRFVEWAQNEIAVVPDFHKRILFSDEAHFWLNGYVNKQNCRIWSEANPQVYVETPLHPEKLTVWCALWAGGIIGPHFFKNDEGHNVSQW
ncbi:DUF4817 domain-containing protein [Trichonephila clavipes]|nr:DUF4817 domain-containing protein [Trichonephila clavipes]